MSITFCRSPTMYTPSVGLRRAGCPVCLPACLYVSRAQTDLTSPQREAARTLALDPELWETLALASDVVAEQEAAAARARVRAERRSRSRHQARRSAADEEEEELGRRWPDHGGGSDHEHDDELSSYGSSRSGSEVCSTPRYSSINSAAPRAIHRPACMRASRSLSVGWGQDGPPPPPSSDEQDEHPHPVRRGSASAMAAAARLREQLAVTGSHASLPADLEV